MIGPARNPSNGKQAALVTCDGKGCEESVIVTAQAEEGDHPEEKYEWSWRYRGAPWSTWIVVTGEMQEPPAGYEHRFRPIGGG